MTIWNDILTELDNDQQVVLMVVLESKGSSPGRQGFKMMVSSSSKLSGSIGGGFMEHKLVELCRQKLLISEFTPFFKKQIHQDSIAKNKSGMICSGEQTIAFYPISKKERDVVIQLKNADSGVIEFSQEGMQMSKNELLDNRYFLMLNTENWSLKEDVSKVDELHIVGGGHVGLALSNNALLLGFRIFTYDDRENLNTVHDNKNACHTFVDDYKSISTKIPDGNHKYVILMSFGYQTDKVVLKSLLQSQFKYLGMMGSKEKVKRLFGELKLEGATAEEIAKIHSPIGVQINSQTPEEIAISILAEVIKIKRA